MKWWSFAIFLFINTSPAYARGLQDLFQNYLVTEPSPYLWEKRFGDHSNAIKAPNSAQTFVKEFDRRLRALHPKALQYIDEPEIIIYPSEQAVAFTEATEICFEAPYPIEIIATPASARKWIAGIRFDTTGSTGVNSSRAECEVRKVSLHDLPELLRALKITSGCELSINDSDKLIQFSKGCSIGGWLKHNGYTHSKSLNLSLTLPYIFVSTGMLEKTAKHPGVLEALIAHELGHLYGAHPSMRDRGFAYFYKQTDRAFFQKPVRLEESYLTQNKINQLDFMSKVMSFRGLNGRNDDNYNIEQSEVVAQLQSAEELGIAKYTIETQADEFLVLALQLMDRPILKNLQTMFEADAFPISDYPFQTSRSDCLSRWKNDWRSSDDELLPIAYGDYMQIHASGCHRIYNMDLHRRYLVK